MFFYLIFPSLYWVMKKVNARLGRGYLYLFVGLSVFLHVVFFSFIFPWPVAKNNVVYYLPIFSVVVFVIGVGAYFIFDGKFASDKPIFDLLLFCVATVANIYIMMNGRDWVYVFLPISAAFSFLCLIKFLAARNCIWPWIRWVGINSYSVYVFHFVVVWLLGLRLTTYVQQFVFNKVAAIGISFVSILFLSTLIATISRALIEEPGIRFGSKVRGRLIISKSLART